MARVRLRPLVPAVAALLVLGACTTTETGHGSLGASAGPSSGGSSPSPGAAAKPQARAKFIDCAADYPGLSGLSFPAGRFQRLSFDCAAISVPLDYAKPSGRSISVQLVRVHDERNTSGRSLVLNPGGPGGSGVELALGLSPRVSDAVLSHYDLLGFDPRGVGSSSPVRCFSDTEKDEANAASPDVRTSTGFADAKALAAKFAKSCDDKYGNDLQYYNTVSTARDMDRIRQSVGDSKLNYLGFSYGTELGAQYAHLFPKNIRVMVLDGAVNPLTSDITAFANQLQGFEGAFDQFAAWCRQQTTCKQVGDPRTAVYRIRDLARTSPIPSGQSSDPRKATLSLVLTGVLSALYSRSQWPTLADALISARGGRSSGLLALADNYNQRYNGRYANIADANVTISCNDSKPGPTDGTVRSTAASWTTRFPMFGLWSAASLFSCASWQSHRTVPALPTATGSAARIVVIGNVHDPATPYQGAVDLAKTLGNARLLSWNGQGHTSYLQGSTCVDDLVDAYLDTGAVPPAGKTCPA